MIKKDWKKNSKRAFVLTVCIAAVTLYMGCTMEVERIVEREVPVSPPEQRPARFVFLFIGDGMGKAQIAAAEIYAHVNNPTLSGMSIRPGQSGNIDVNRLEFSRFPVRGSQTTHDFNSFVTDSASAGTAIASGRKTTSGSININPAIDPNVEFKTIAEHARDAGMRVGIVSSVMLTHATPAAFYGKVSDRNDTNTLAQQLIDSGFHFFGGGNIVSSASQSNAFLAQAQAAGYNVVRTRSGLEALTSASGRVIAIPPAASLQDGALFYEIDRDPTNEEHWTLADLTRKGIEVLYNPNGFFMMIESGKIDWAGHANDAVTIIYDIFALDQAVRIALEFAARYPEETLIVVTGDHETGGMTIGRGGSHNTDFSLLNGQTMSHVEIQRQLPIVRRTLTTGNTIADIDVFLQQAFGININDGNGSIQSTIRAGGRDTFSSAERAAIETAFLESFGAQVGGSLGSSNSALVNTVIKLLNTRAGIGWTTTGHTGIPVPVYAFGTRAALFGGNYDNTDIFFKLASAMGLEVGSTPSP